MEDKIPENLLIRELASRYRVILVGGMAVIGHGHARLTKDYDIWLEPMETAGEWADVLVSTCARHPEARFWSLAQKRDMTPCEVAAEVEETNVVRVTGLNLPVDVFRCPNEMEVADFDLVWSRASVMEDNVALPDPIDLYLTKADTGREQDWQDQIFLESKVKDFFRERLPVCPLEEAQGLLKRFVDPQVLEFALVNPDPAVRELVLSELRLFEAEGDPYSRDILASSQKREKAGQ